MKTISAIFIAVFLACNLATAQDTMYVYRAGAVIIKQAVAEIDSVIFYNPSTIVKVTDIDGNVYHSVTIGTQTWLVENLRTTKYNDGTSIPFVADGTAWAALSTPGYCFYNNNAANKTTYGALYNWYTVNTGKLAPTGWHVPTDAEWTTFEDYLIANGYNYDGTTTGNKIAKSLAANTDWLTSTNSGAVGNNLSKNNTSGFAGLPVGCRNFDGLFYDSSIYGYWWSSTEGNSNSAWRRLINYNEASVYKYDNQKKLGFSVRCLKDVNTPVLSKPILSTTAANAITPTTAACGGTITSNGGAPITASGVCWSTTTNPTTANAKTTDVTTSGSFTSSLIGLISDTTYYVRAYATNSVGTAYGNEVSFRTLTNSITDIDGNVYHSVTIGTQTWMVENLKTTKYNDGTSIPNVADGKTWASLTTPGYCFYSNDVANKTHYGALYNWFTINTGKLAPTGWHVPTDAEWTTLENYLIANGFNYDGTTTENKIAKSLAASTGWNTSSIIGAIGNDLTKNNSSGFSALPGGYRVYDGSFDMAGSGGNWWSSSENSADNAWNRDLGSDYNWVFRRHYTGGKQWGYSVRCVRDDDTTTPKDSVTYSMSDVEGTWQRHSLITTSSNSGFWIHGTIVNSNGSSASHLILPNGTMDTTLISVGATITDGALTTASDPAAHTFISSDKSLMVGTTKRSNYYTLIFDQKTVSGTSYSTADLQGTWQTHCLVSGGNWIGWIHAVSVIDNSGNCTSSTLVKSDGTGGTSSGGTSIVSSSGVITMNEVASYNGFLSFDKTLMTSNMTDGGGGGMLSIVQKMVVGTTYNIADLKGTWQLHSLSVGSENWTEHGIMTIDASGNGTISNMVKDDGGAYFNTGTKALSISHDGVVTFGTDFHGFLSADKKLVIGTKSDDSGHAYSLVVLQKMP